MSIRKIFATAALGALIALLCALIVLLLVRQSAETIPISVAPTVPAADVERAEANNTPTPSTPGRTQLEIRELSESVDSLTAQVEELAHANTLLAHQIEAMEQEPAVPGRQTAASQPEGICGRTPVVQKWILARLDINACQVITSGELFRLEGDIGVSAKEFRPGDFAGLVNMSGANIYSDYPLPLGVFDGSGFQSLDVCMDCLQPGIFQGLDSLTSLNIYLNETHNRPEDRPSALLSKNHFQGIPNLTSLSIGANSSGYSDYDIAKDALSLIPNLEQIGIPFPNRTVPSGFFRHNEALKLIQLGHSYQISADGAHEEILLTRVPKDLVAHLEHLESLTLTGEHPIILNHQSPLFQAHLNGSRDAQSYTVVLE